VIVVVLPSLSVEGLLIALVAVAAVEVVAVMMSLERSCSYLEYGTP
jgi:hypothetical protein